MAVLAVGAVVATPITGGAVGPGSIDFTSATATVAEGRCLRDDGEPDGPADRRHRRRGDGRLRGHRRVGDARRRLRHHRRRHGHPHVGRRRRRVAEHHLLRESRQRGRVRRDGSPVAQQRDRCRARRRHEHHGHDHQRRQRWLGRVLRHHLQRIRGRRFRADGDGLRRAQRAGRRIRRACSTTRPTARPAAATTAVATGCSSGGTDRPVSGRSRSRSPTTRPSRAPRRSRCRCRMPSVRCWAPRRRRRCRSPTTTAVAPSRSRPRSYSGSEVDGSAPTVTISVVRSAPADGPASVQYHSADGTAGSADYGGGDGVLGWGAGQTGVRSFTVSITDDAAIESTETVALSLSNAAGAVLGAPASATLSITDDDNGGSIAFSSATYSGSEVDGSAPTVTITVNRTGSDGPASVQYNSNDRHRDRRRLRRRRRHVLLGFRGEPDRARTPSRSTTTTLSNPPRHAHLSLSNVTGAVLGTPNTATLDDHRRRSRRHGAVRQRRLFGHRG